MREAVAVRWWKRLVCSFLSMLLAAIFCGVFFELNHLLDPGTHFSVVDLLWFIYPVLVFCLPGWVLALPVVLAVTNFRGWRFWFILAVGSCIGPIVILGLVLYSQLSDPHSGDFWAGWGFFVLASAVSFITTLIYLLLIRDAQFRQIPDSDKVDGKDKRTV